MKQRMITLSGCLPLAVIEGRKTQTRRLVNPQPLETAIGWVWKPETINRSWNQVAKSQDLASLALGCECPYGQPGDQLIVREEHFRFGHWESVVGVKTKTGRQKWRFVADDWVVRFPDEADAPKAFRKGMHRDTPDYKFWHKRLARFMPRSLARIKLEIVSVRVERLNDISDDDCAAEGIQTSIGSGLIAGERVFHFPNGNGYSRIGWHAFSALWDSIHDDWKWVTNPHVWVITFKRIHVE